jgi:GNAT superfamily N-acetyltransferase
MNNKDWAQLEPLAQGVDDAPALATLIRAANAPVAQRFGLTASNCPSHPSLCQADGVVQDMARGQRYFAIEHAQVLVACIAYHAARPGVAYLNRLSVQPAHQCQGLGERLVRHVLSLAIADQAQRVSIGIIAGFDELQAWYERLGFVAAHTQRFEHLPFDVLYMHHRLGATH